MKLQLGDIVRGKNPYPFDVYGRQWEVVGIRPTHLNKSCWLRLCGSSRWFEYPVGEDLLILVRRTLTPEQVRIRELEDRMEQLERQRQ